MPRRALPLRGIVLIFVSGILVLTALAAVLLIQTGLLAAAHAWMDVSRAEARIAAEAGLEYAVARLRQAPYPFSTPSIPPNLLTRGDDWSCRDAAPAPTAGLSTNPSWARGDGWAETTPDGIHTPGEPVLASRDLDGDGALDILTGRLRGTLSTAPRFSLRVAASASLACVNSGETGDAAGDHDVDGVLNADDPTYGSDLNANNIDDWQDAALEGNRHLVNFLNNLGHVAGLPPPPTPLLYAPNLPATAAINTTGAYSATELGRRVVEGRPRGGYRSVAQVRAAIVPAFYTEAEFAKVEPYLAVEGEAVPVAFPAATKQLGSYTNILAQPETRYEFHVPVDFNRAPVPVLQALLRYLSSSSCYYRTGFIPSQYRFHPLCAPFARLLAQEADGIATSLAAARPVHSWGQMLQALSDPALAVWQDDPFTKDDPATTTIDEGNDVSGERRRIKEDLILAQIADDGYFIDGQSCRAGSLDVPRQGPWPDGARTRTVMKPYLASGLNLLPYDPTGNPQPWLNQAAFNAVNGIQTRMTVEWNLDARPPGRFRIESDGQAPVRSGGQIDRRLAGEILLEKMFRIGGQQDFDPVSTPLRPVSPASPWRLAKGDVSYDLSVTQTRNGTQSGPRFPLTSAVTGNTNYVSAALPVPPPPPDPHFRHPTALGSLRLSARQWTDAELSVLHGTVVSAFPFNEDLAPGTANLYDPAAWQDNLGDPIRALSGNPRVPGLTVHMPAFHQGIAFGPSGPRFAHAISNNFVPPDLLSADWPVFPSSRADYPGDPSQTPPVPPVPGGGEITEGTISFWAPAWGATPQADGLPLRGIFALKYFTTIASMNQFVVLLKVKVQDDGSLSLSSNGTPAAIIRPDTASPLFPAASAWHHYALSFEDAGAPGDGLTAVHAFIDGIRSPDTPVGSPLVLTQIDNAVPPIDTKAYFVVDAFPLDDILFYGESLHLTPDSIKKVAATERFHAGTGAWTSTRFVFDPIRFSDGVSLDGASWDAVVPQETGGSFIFDVKAYDAGNVLMNPASSDPGRNIQWTAGPAWSAFSLKGVRAIELEVRIQTSPTLVMDVGSGILAHVLRDTPALDAFAVFYGNPGGSPWTTGIEER